VRAELSWGLGRWVPTEAFRLALEKMIETIFLALMGTTFAMIVSVPLSFLGARNLMQGTRLGWALYYLTRTIFNVLRSIETLILAVIMAVVVGLGPFAGVMAIVIHSIGAMGKLYSEAIESIDPGPIEAITATGANRFQVVLFAVVPQVVPQFLSFTMYRWDINVRLSTVIGLVGGGGIGFLLIQYINLLQWNQAGAALWMIAITVMVMDYASAVIRARLV
jgi:phosphonate transport system permease protein